MSDKEPAPLTLALLEEMRPKRSLRRGRPTPLNIGEIAESKGYKLARAVHEQVQHGSKRATAIRKVAEGNFVSESTVRQALKMNQKQQTAVVAAEWAQVESRAFDQMERTYSEAKRRMSGMPDDIRITLTDISAVALLESLRAASIDGTCPSWLVDVVRRTKHLGPGVVEAVFVKAAADPKRSDWLESVLIEAGNKPSRI